MLPVSPAPNPASTRKPNSSGVTVAAPGRARRARGHACITGSAPAARGRHRGVVGARRGWCDRRMTSPDDDRTEPPADADERTLLVGWLEFHRADARPQVRRPHRRAAAAAAPCRRPPLSLIGLVRHLTEIERLYLRHGFAGESISPLQYVTDEEPEGDFDLLDDVRGSLAAWQEHVAANREHVAAAADLDAKRRPVAGDAALGAGQGRAGVRPAQRPRRPAAPGPRRRHGGVAGRPSAVIIGRWLLDSARPRVAAICR